MTIFYPTLPEFHAGKAQYEQPPIPKLSSPPKQKLRGPSGEADVAKANKAFNEDMIPHNHALTLSNDAHEESLGLFSAKDAPSILHMAHRAAERMDHYRAADYHNAASRMHLEAARNDPDKAHGHRRAAVAHKLASDAHRKAEGQGSITSHYSETDQYGGSGGGASPTFGPSRVSSRVGGPMPPKMPQTHALPSYDEHHIRHAISQYPDWSRAERKRLPEVTEEIVNHVKNGGGNQFIQHFTNHILPGLMKKHPLPKDQYAEETDPYVLEGREAKQAGKHAREMSKKVDTGEATHAEAAKAHDIAQAAFTMTDDHPGHAAQAIYHHNQWKHHHKQAGGSTDQYAAGDFGFKEGLGTPGQNRPTSSGNMAKRPPAKPAGQGNAGHNRPTSGLMPTSPPRVGTAVVQTNIKPSGEGKRTMAAMAAMKLSSAAGTAGHLAKFHNLKGMHEHAANLHSIAAEAHRSLGTEFQDSAETKQSAVHDAAAKEHSNLAKSARDA